MATNHRYGVMPSAPSSLTCILCQVPHNDVRVFPCNCLLPVHEECALIILRQRQFRCPLCETSYAFPLHTPATSIMGDSISEQFPSVRTEILCRSSYKTAKFVFIMIVMLFLGALVMYLFLKYF
jgi:hypothetical protein